MEFIIYTMNDSGSGMEYYSKEKFLKEMSLMIDDCIANGGTYFSVQVDADASCFYIEEEDEETEEEIAKRTKELEAFSMNVKEKRRKCPHGYWLTNKGNKLNIDDVDQTRDFGGYYCELQKSHVTPIMCSDCECWR